MAVKAPWMRQGRCLSVDPDMFHPTKGAIYQLDLARAVCFSCPVQEQCLVHALQEGEHQGVWGGTAERERRKLRCRSCERCGQRLTYEEAARCYLQQAGRWRCRACGGPDGCDWAAYRAAKDRAERAARRAKARWQPNYGQSRRRS